ncbi:hypothetical protein FN846DRAFT_984202 [Sphaerosporella brunnea]|uniref:RRM domain-containing protein n=1 Tax=Sphaerosporella brunnea TaxID=1250544 RepID=A0A5J5EUP5_9PEZI|nr:hypothetical protein FN846DRAFT_984202 [Sphaerosporella brunnea]
MDTEHGTCKGYGFARYETKQQAENCIRGLVSQKYEAGFARESFNARLKTLADPNSTNIYVSNLPRNMTEKDMQDIFAGYTVVSNRILRDANGVSRGVGFARFESREICDEIIKKFHGIPVGEEALALQVRYADTSAQKRLKATTTKKRQFRSNEYNSAHNGNLASRDTHSSASARRNWDRSQDWKNTGDENKDWKPTNSWRNTGSVSTDIKLETVHEDDDDDLVSEAHSEGNSPLPFSILARNSVGRASTGSMSDPGDSYGGREYGRDDDFELSRL